MVSEQVLKQSGSCSPSNIRDCTRGRFPSLLGILLGCGRCCVAVDLGFLGLVAGKPVVEDGGHVECYVLVE